MKEIVIQTIDEFHRNLEIYKKVNMFKFRGQSDLKWELIPKAGRTPFTNASDIELFRNWKRRAMSLLERENYSEWELLAIAQHTGLPTRLLDWTHNPLIAAFFSANDHPDKDGVIYAYKPEAIISHEIFHPFEKSFMNKRIAFFQPSFASNRIANQLSYFSIHCNPKTSLSDKTRDGVLEKIVIKKEIKKELVFMLNQYCINYMTLFPDLEGLSKHLCWFSENYQYWDNTFDEQDISLSKKGSR